MKRLVLAFGMLGLVATIVVACQQGKGDRCQIDDDCGNDLVCNKATNTCQETTGGGIDAAVPVQTDAGVDAPPDTM